MVMKLALDWTTEEMQRLKRHRKRLGLTQAQLAQKLGVKQSMISRMEHGRTPSTVVAAGVRIYLNHHEPTKPGARG